MTISCLLNDTRCCVRRSLATLGITVLLGVIMLFGMTPVYADVDQFLNDYFFRNPADLGLVNKNRAVVGNLYVVPRLEFTGTTQIGTGRAQSKVNNSLPYLLADFRVSDQWVLGVNIVPSAYGNINWPQDSIVAYDSTITKVYYYRFGAQASYQVTDRLMLGIGANLHYHYLAELDALIPGLGNEVNKISAVNNSFDAGFLYKINQKHNLVAALYTPVDTYGSGTSTLNGVTSRDFSLNISEAPVLYIGLQHYFLEQWFLQEKVFWSGWHIQKSTNLLHTTRGNLLYPTDWVDTWSFQVLSRYAMNDTIAWLGSIMYETNAAPVSTNAIGYPLAPSLSISGGIDLALRPDLSMQVVYGYAMFIPKAIIDTATSHGFISANAQAATLQFIYKI